MPHIKLEHSNEIDTKKLLEVLHLKLSTFKTIDISTIKSRSISAENYITGNKTENLFIHLLIELLEGREEELLRDILVSMNNELKNFIKDQEHLISISTRIVEVKKSLYLTLNS